MKKIFLSLAFSALISGVLYAQVATPAAPEAPATPSSNAKFNFVEEVHDFGNQEEGPKYEHEFRFTNTGTDPLIINNVRASCGCTTPSWPKEPIMPGQQGVISAVYNSQGRVGNFNKAITVTSNADSPTKVLYIKGTIVAATNNGMPEKKPSIMSEPAGKSN